ncbi:variable surface protein [Plasmodium gonderi]|uniref:Variable surface protein n=1 Tax=Plasmodium gonderi TaxID=77519 RepID=A0A1Y1JRY7_PLAGO|nr:variable surface protein [Plasmodium gonderi]GAW84218.1 variable surface protein [Plasmodium gonderi]
MLKTEKWKEFEQLAVSFGGDLTSEKFYDKLYNLRNFSHYANNCENLSSYKNGSAVKNVCAKILTYLSSNEELRSNSNVYDVCRLLNYWVATNLSAIGGYGNSSYTIDTFSKISIIWNEFIMNKLQNNHHQTCNPRIDMISHSDWSKRKEVYDYYVDHAYLSGMSTILVNPTDYCIHIRKKISLYDYFNVKCALDETAFCYEFKTKYKNCDPKELLLKFNCAKEVEEKKSLEKKTERELHQGASSERGMFQRESQLQDYTTEGTQNLKVLKTMSNRFSPLKKAGGILLGIVAISMAYGFLHKFTPLGIWIRNIFANKNNNRNNINSDFNEEFYYSQRLYDQNYNNRDEHCIGYHSD